MISKGMKCAFLLGLHWTFVHTRNMYFKQADWKWTEQRHSGRGDMDSSSTRGVKGSKQMWNWRDVPDNNIIKLKESPRNKVKESNDDVVGKTYPHTAPFHILNVGSTTTKPQLKRKLPRKQYVPFNR